MAYFRTSNLSFPTGVKGWEAVDRMAGAQRGIIEVKGEGEINRLRDLAGHHPFIEEIGQDEYASLAQKKNSDALRLQNLEKRVAARRAASSGNSNCRSCGKRRGKKVR